MLIVYYILFLVYIQNAKDYAVLATQHAEEFLPFGTVHQDAEKYAAK